MIYNELMQKAGKRISPKFYYYDDDNSKVEILQDNIKFAKPFFNCSIIGTVMKGLKAEIKTELPDKAIYFENTVRYGTNSAIRTTGPFYLKEKPEYNADEKTYTHVLYDTFLKTMVEYKPIDIVYPCTVLAFFKKLCVTCGFTTNITSLPNGKRVLNHDIYNGIDFTFRDVFEDIGYATASLFKVNGLNMERCSLKTNNIIINDDILKKENITIGNHIGPINSIILSRSADSDFIYKRDESLTEWNEFKILDNQLMNDNNRSDYLDELYEALYGLEYDLFDLELVGYGGFEPLQKITITTNTQTANSFIFNNEEEFTQGYKECIFAERPEETEADYTKSDKSDKSFNQVYIIVDKQNKKIESVVSQVDSQNQKISSITQTVNELNSKISDIADITISGENNYGTIELDNINTSEPIRIVVKPVGESIAYLYPANDLYPSNDLFLKDRLIRFVNKSTNEVTDYDLPDDLWYINSECYDEFILDYDSQTCIINKKVKLNEDGSLTPLILPKTIEFEFPHINLTDGDYKITIPGYNNAYLFVRLMAQNIYTTQFATKAELHSSITQTSNTIDLELSKKLDSKEFNGASIKMAINQDYSSIKINADNLDISANNILDIISNNVINLSSKNISITSNNFKVDSTGNIICSNIKATNGSFNGKIDSDTGKIGGWDISSSGFSNGQFFVKSNGYSNIYTFADLIILKNCLEGKLSYSGLENHYDVNGDGTVDILDLLAVQKMILGE